MSSCSYSLPWWTSFHHKSSKYIAYLGFLFPPGPRQTLLISHCFLLSRNWMELCYELIVIIIIMPTKVHLVKAMVFPVVMYGYVIWTIKKAGHWRVDAFELCCWRRLLRVPWTSRRSNESILKEISPEYSLEGLMLKLKLQYVGHLMQRTDSL